MKDRILKKPAMTKYKLRMVVTNDGSFSNSFSILIIKKAAYAKNDENSMKFQTSEKYSTKLYDFS